MYPCPAKRQKVSVMTVIDMLLLVVRQSCREDGTVETETCGVAEKET